jgi:hypothetical protein
VCVWWPFTIDFPIDAPLPNVHPPLWICVTTSINQAPMDVVSVDSSAWTYSSAAFQAFHITRGGMCWAGQCHDQCRSLHHSQLIVHSSNFSPHVCNVRKKVYLKLNMASSGSSKGIGIHYYWRRWCLHYQYFAHTESILTWYIRMPCIHVMTPIWLYSSWDRGLWGCIVYSIDRRLGFVNLWQAVCSRAAVE